MGEMDTGSALTRINLNVNVYLPMFVLVFCTCTYLNVWSKLLTFFGMERFEFVEDVANNARLDEGRELLQRERDAVERALSRQALHSSGDRQRGMTREGGYTYS